MSSATDITSEAKADPVREELVAAIKLRLGDAVVESLVKAGDDIWLRIADDSWVLTLQVLRDEFEFDYFNFLSAIDWMPSPFGKGEDDPTAPPPERDDTIRPGYAGGNSRFQVLARLNNLKTNLGINLKLDVNHLMTVPSVVKVFAGANWHEREAHEMFGITFAGHPDLRNIYLPTGFEGYPLRKDFPLLARMIKPWPGIVDVEPLPGDEEEGGDE